MLDGQIAQIHPRVFGAQQNRSLARASSVRGGIDALLEHALENAGSATSYGIRCGLAAGLPNKVILETDQGATPADSAAPDDRVAKGFEAQMKRFM